MAKNLLPVVNANIGSAIQAEMLQREGNQYVVEIIRKLQKENPCVANFISSFSTKSADPISAAYCGALVYKILESQAEADELKKGFKL